jgi:hypothetical protein
MRVVYDAERHLCNGEAIGRISAMPIGVKRSAT